jgi:DNA gyrase/topoisomerase IV subunit B
VQVFSGNMGNKSKPEITKCKQSENWTRVTFKPDLEKFNMSELEKDVVALMKKRVVDMAGTLGKTVKVELNDQKVPVKCFSEYVQLYIDSANKEGPNKEGPELQRFDIVLINLGLSVRSSYPTICANPNLSSFQSPPKGK